MTVSEALEVLALPARPEAGELRRAYLRAVKRHPPERDPVGFQNVRGAFELLSELPSQEIRSEVPATVPVSAAEVRSESDAPEVAPDPFDDIRTRCETLAREHKHDVLVTLLAEHAYDWRARALALGTYGDFLPPFFLGYFAAWPLEGDARSSIVVPSGGDASRLSVRLRQDPGNFDIIRAVVEKLADMDRRAAVSFLFGLDRANVGWARVQLLTRFAEDVPAEHLTMLVSTAPPQLLAELHRFGVARSVCREILRIRLEQWRASVADPSVSPPSMDDLAFDAMLGLSAAEVAIPHELVAAATMRDDAVRNRSDGRGSSALHLHFARALLDLGDDFPNELRALLATGILEGAPERQAPPIRDMVAALSREDFERAKRVRTSTVLAPYYGQAIYEGGRQRETGTPGRVKPVDTAAPDLVNVLRIVFSLSVLAAGIGGIWSDPSTLIPGGMLIILCLLFFAPGLVKRQSGTKTGKRRKIAIPLVVTAGIFLFWAFVFRPIISIFWQGMTAVQLTEQIESALGDPLANVQLASFELSRTEQGRQASSWMTQQLAAASKENATPWAPLLRDWCIVANVSQTGSLCEHAAIVFPTLDAEGPCPSDLRPFASPETEVAARIGMDVLSPSVEALHKRSAELINDRCVPP